MGSSRFYRFKGFKGFKGPQYPKGGGPWDLLNL